MKRILTAVALFLFAFVHAPSAARAQNSTTYAVEAVAGSPSTITCSLMGQGPMLELEDIACEYRVPVSPYGMNTRAIRTQYSFAATCPQWGVENMLDNPFAGWSQSYGFACELSVKGTRRAPERAALSLPNVGFTYVVGGGGLASFDGSDDYSGASGRWGSGVACTLTGSHLTTDPYACRRVAYGHPSDPSRVRIDLVTKWHQRRWYFISNAQPELGYQLGSGHGWDAACTLTMSRPVLYVTYYDYVPQS